jgi:magnesium-transporting ATPase (P-type)
MISGDHIETAKLVAIKSGIISYEESNNEDVCMTGEIFRAKIGDY